MEETYRNESPVILEVTAGDETLATTPGHPFSVLDHGWKDAGELEVGDRLVTLRGESVVEDIRRRPVPEPVYNFKVSGLHTYFVGKKEIWVHNSSDGKVAVDAASGVSTAQDDAAFWSGRAGANRSAAEASGLTTLEKTPAGQALDAQDLFSKLDYDEAILPWEDLSGQFASEASGTVTAWTGGASPISVWSRIERPRFISNANVRKIVIKDATQPWKTKIIYK